MNKLKQGTLVEFNSYGVKGEGIIVGYTLNFGDEYIIEPTHSIKTDSYPYTHLICSINDIKVVSKTFSTPEDRKDSPHHHANRLD